MTYQQTNEWEKAIVQYRIVTAVTTDAERNKTASIAAVAERIKVEAKIRECDLLQALDRMQEATVCWLQAIGLFPNEHVPHNELGNIYGRAGHYEQAADSYSQAAQLGSLLAELNLAHMLELQGFYMESRQGYQEALTKAEVSGLPQYHIRVRMKTVLPRILPATESGDIFPLYSLPLFPPNLYPANLPPLSPLLTTLYSRPFTLVPFLFTD